MSSSEVQAALALLARLPRAVLVRAGAPAGEPATDAMQGGMMAGAQEHQGVLGVVDVMERGQAGALPAEEIRADALARTRQLPPVLPVVDPAHHVSLPTRLRYVTDAMPLPVADQAEPEEVVFVVRARLRAKLNVMYLHARPELAEVAGLAYVLEPESSERSGVLVPAQRPRVR